MLILDVGCGDRPKGTVNVDLYVGRSGHLYHEDKIIKPKSIPNFVRADAHCLPFRNSIFSKVVTHHTLEHLSNPMKAIKEMLRVTNKTLEIVVPWWVAEEFHGFFHPKKRIKWLRKYHKHRFSKKRLHQIFRKLNLRHSIKYIFNRYHITLFVPIPDQMLCVVHKH